MKLNLLGLAILALLSSPAQAAAKVSGGGTVPREKWLESMKTLLPTIFCQPGGFYRLCSSQNEDACLAEALRATKACALKIADDLPKELHQPADGTKWGEELGKCAGSTLELSLQAADKWKDSADCKEPPKAAKPAAKVVH